MWLGDNVGVVGFAALLSFFGPQFGMVDFAAFAEIASAPTAHAWWVVLISAVLAGWLMGLLTWLVGAAKETIPQLLIVVIVTGSIGFAGLHHAIAGAVEGMFGVFSGSETLGAFLAFLIWITIGNAFGGTVFVAVLKYAHAVRSSEG